MGVIVCKEMVQLQIINSRAENTKRHKLHNLAMKFDHSELIAAGSLTRLVFWGYELFVYMKLANATRWRCSSRWQRHEQRLAS